MPDVIIRIRVLHAIRPTLHEQNGRVIKTVLFVPVPARILMETDVAKNFLVRQAHNSKLNFSINLCTIMHATILYMTQRV